MRLVYIEGAWRALIGLMGIAPNHAVSGVSGGWGGARKKPAGAWFSRQRQNTSLVFIKHFLNGFSREFRGF
jgi:nicotinamide mononucleotide (NMN) deamidase PncC